jgi:hypothetical protein
MVKQAYDHYICDHCGNEIVEKNKTDTSKWITIARAGSHFHETEQLMISYMKPGWNTYALTGFKSKLIKTNLYFCCKECLLKFMLKHLEEPDDISALSITLEPVKPISRFDGIEIQSNNEDNNDGTNGNGNTDESV